MKSKTKKPSLRSRMRVDASVELRQLVVSGSVAVAKIAHKGGISGTELAKMIGGGHTDTLEKSLITKLANRKEAELEKIYNAQKAEESAK